MNEEGHKLLRGEIRPLKTREELLLYGFVANDPANTLDLLGLGHNFGRCHNSSSGDEWALEGGKWKKLKPGESTGLFGDCDGMTCNGAFYSVSALTEMNCKKGDCQDSPFAGNGWTPANPEKGKPPGGRGSESGNTPPGYSYTPQAECPPQPACKSGTPH